MSEKGQRNSNEIQGKTKWSEKVAFPIRKVGLCVFIVLPYLARHHCVQHTTSQKGYRLPFACAVAVCSL